MPILTGSLYYDTLVVTISILVVTISFFKWSLTFWSRRGVYTLPYSIPFGNAGDVLKQKTTRGEEFKKVYQEIKGAGKRYGGYYMLIKPVFIPVDLDLIKQMLTKDFAHFTNHVNTVDEKTDPLTGNLFFLKDAKWKNLRNTLAPTFTSGKMKMMFQTLKDCSKELIWVVERHSKENEPMDVKDLVARFTTDVIGSCGFGINCNSLKDPNSEFCEFAKKALDPSLWDSVKRLLMFTVPEIQKYLKLRVFRKDVYEFFTSIVKNTVDYREENNLVRKDFMHLLIQLKNNVQIEENTLGDLKSSNVNGKQEIFFTADELTAQAFVFFIAGSDTSSTTTTFCLYELARNPEIQEKLRREINETLDNNGGDLSYEAVMEMTFMDQCIKETLRKYPAVTVLTRECTQTYKVPNSDLILEKGSCVFISIMGIHHDAEYYPEPEIFDPERFSKENKALRNSSTWLPFGDGPRICIGMRFGLTQIKVSLVALLKNFKFTVNSRTKVPLKMDRRSLFLAVEKGIWLNAQKIQ